MVRIITEVCAVVWKERTANQPGTVGTVRESCEEKFQSKLLRNKIKGVGALKGFPNKGSSIGMMWGHEEF